MRQRGKLGFSPNSRILCDMKNSIHMPGVVFRRYRTRLCTTLVCMVVLWTATKTSAQAPQAGFFVDGAANDGIIPEAAQVLSAYIAVPSPSGQEKAAGEFLSQLCREKRLAVEVFSSEENSYNFAASLYPLDRQKPNIIFLNHLDVVPPGDEGHWRRPPFSGYIDGDTVWGRGAVDMKGMAVMQVLALAQFVELARLHDLPYNATVLSVSGEEQLGALGADRVVARHLDRLQACVVLGEGGAGVKEMVVSDPARLVFGITVGSKRGLWLRLRLATATMGHGSVPPHEYAGKDMVQCLSRVLGKKQRLRFSPQTRRMFREMGKLESGLRGFVLRHNGLFRPLLRPALRREPVAASLVSNTLALTHLVTPAGEPNQLAQEITAHLDCRLLPGVDTDAFLRRLKRQIRHPDISVEIVQESPQAGYSEPDLFYAHFSAALTEVHPEGAVVPILFPASNDNSYFQAKGIPAYGIFPAYLSRDLMYAIHNSNERIPFEALESGIATYTAFLRRVMVLPGHIRE